MTTYIRVDVWSLAEDDPIVVAYGDAVTAMRAKPDSDPTSWAYQAAIHGTHTTPGRTGWNQCQHQGWYFASWHRLYLYFFERIVRAQVVANGGPATWALPYWNYDGAGHNSLPPAFRNPTRSDGSPNPLYTADRNPAINAGAGLSPAITSPALALAKTSYTGVGEFGGGVTDPPIRFDGETGQLEQTPHNDIHNAVGGLMLDPDTAASDPIFWLHHANIDRIWWLWQQHHLDPTDASWLTQAFPFFDVGAAPAAMADSLTRDTVNQLSYTYDHAVITIPPPIRRWPLPIRWPEPWPEHPVGTPRPIGPDPAPLSARELIGAAAEPVTLVGDTAHTTVAIDTRAADAVATNLIAVPRQHRAFIDLSDIRADHNPGTIYGVYVNLPENPTPADLESHHVGNLSFFGLERASAPRSDSHGHGMHVSLEITDVLDRLAAEGEWTDGSRLRVSFVPITLTPPADRDIDIPSPAHPENPVQVGSVRLHFA